MRLIKKLFTFLALLVLVLVLISFFLPQKQHVERQINITASPDNIYPHLANPRLFSQWSPWSALDPMMKVEFTGPASGKGAGMSWQSDQPSVGSGTWLITEAIPNKSLRVAMDFGDQGGATSFFNVVPMDNQTTVIWGFDNDAGYNPIMRWFGLLMDKMVGDEYAKGLANLKQKIEKER